MKYGVKTTSEEYQAQAIQLHDREDYSLSTRRRIEMELAVNHNLGIDFPVLGRARLWLAYEACEKKRLALIDSCTLIKRFIPQFEFLQMLWLFRYGRKQFAMALSKEDLKAFLGD